VFGSKSEFQKKNVEISKKILVLNPPKNFEKKIWNSLPRKRRPETDPIIRSHFKKLLFFRSHISKNFKILEQKKAKFSN